MKLGIIGLGKLGEAIAYRVIKGGGDVFGFDLDQNARDDAATIGVQVLSSIEAVANKTDVVWIMVPAGKPVDDVINELAKYLDAGSIIIDGGNSKFTDSIRRADELARFHLLFLDCGTSGGLKGREIGFSLMVGGNRQAYDRVTPFLSVIAAPNGYGYMGPSGAGHYVKMVHNGIEYALLQAYAEGFHLLKDGHYNDLNLAEIAGVWRNGSVIRSWILELAHQIFLHDQELKDISGIVQEGGTGKWTVEEALKNNIPTQLIDDALQIRFRSQETGGNYATKVVALLRHQFGGHAVKKIDKER